MLPLSQGLLASRKYREAYLQLHLGDRRNTLLAGMKLKFLPAKVEAKNSLSRQTATAFRTFFCQYQRRQFEDSFGTIISVPKLTNGQSKTLSTFVISYDIKSRACYGRIYQFLLRFGSISDSSGLAMGVITVEPAVKYSFV